MIRTSLTVTLQRRASGVGVALSRMPPAPVEALLIGRPVAEARSLLERLFAVCGKAHTAAFDLALGLETAGSGDLAEEIRVNHLALLFVHLPPLLGLPPNPPPRQELTAAILGQAASLFAAGDLSGWLSSNSGLASLLSRIAAAFAPGEADPALPPLAMGAAPRPGLALNLPAARVAGHPIMRQAAERFGRGPLWQALGLVADLLALGVPERLTAKRLGPGQALAPTARGSCFLTAQARNGQLTHFQRLTPTDDLTTPGGALERALARLDTARIGLAPLVVALLNPCEQVTVTEMADA